MQKRSVLKIVDQLGQKASKRQASKVIARPVSETMPEIVALDKDKLNNHQAIYNYSIESPDSFWGTLAKNRLTWMKEFTQTSSINMDEADFRWFADGKLSANENLVDRHAAKNGDKLAFIWEKDEPGQHVPITFSELKSTVSKLANFMASTLNVKPHDRVVLYMPVGPMAVAAMLACSRIGAIHSVVFAGFSSEALAQRINDGGATIVITADQAVRGRKKINLKPLVDAAVAKCPQVTNVLVHRRTGEPINMVAKRDAYIEDEIKNVSDNFEPFTGDSEHPLFMLYTSGSTGKPKGIVHSTAGYLLYAGFTHQQVFDVRENDVFGCVGDIGWITGHSYVVYGPLMNGTTSVLFESTPTFPDPGRYWETVERLGITQFYGSPTAYRTLLKEGDEYPNHYAMPSLRVIGSVGEPINHEAWHWINEVVGKKRCMLVDTWWQTETGGIMIAPSPADNGASIEPAIAQRPFYGIKPVLQAPEGSELHEHTDQGSLCIAKAWPGIARTIHGDHERYIETYFKPFKGAYACGDAAMIDTETGYVAITGRLDDVINVSGHRLGTAEIEDVMDEHEDVAEAAVVSFPHPVKGEAVCAFVSVKSEVHHKREEICEEVKQLVRKNIASYAVPEYILVSKLGLPKTRSGKIMRRMLKKIAKNDFNDMGDTSTLADPAVIDHILEEYTTAGFGNWDAKHAEQYAAVQQHAQDQKMLGSA